MQCALQGANWEADVRDVAKYLACFPDPLGAMPHAWDETTRKKVRRRALARVFSLARFGRSDLQQFSRCCISA